MYGKWFICVPMASTGKPAGSTWTKSSALPGAKPKLIIAGGSAYARLWDFERFRKIGKRRRVSLSWIWRFSLALVAGGAHPSPFPHAHVVTTTTHKTLRGPRAGSTSPMTRHRQEDQFGDFPGLQGGSAHACDRGEAVAFGEALRPEFKVYAKAVADNAKSLASTLLESGIDLVTGGTDNHLMLVDLRSKGLTARPPKLRSVARISPATRMACRSIRRSPS